MTDLELKAVAAGAWDYIAERREGLLHNEPGMPPRLALDMIMDAGCEKERAVSLLHGAACDWLLEVARGTVDGLVFNGWARTREVLYWMGYTRRGATYALQRAAGELSVGAAEISSQPIYSPSEAAARAQWFEWARAARHALDWLTQAQGLTVAVPA